MNRPRAAALDLGSTRFKRARLDVHGRLDALAACATPPLDGTGACREGDPAAWAAAADGLLAALSAELGGATPVALASQRSTCLVWRADDGTPLTPVVSWQDRRAAEWCAGHASLGPEIQRISGLPLSAHYVGPKLAAMQAASPALRAELHGGGALIGTLDAWLVWRWSGGRVHRTELSMAARTQLADIERGAWSARLLDVFDVPLTALPRIEIDDAIGLALPGGATLQSTIADQAAGALALLPADGATMLINLGTGAFAMRRLDAGEPVEPGFVVAPLGGGGSQRAVEGAINGSGPALSRFGRGPSRLPARDTLGDAFAIPDQSGLGAPHWRPRIGLCLSPAATGLDRATTRRIVLEGVLFRLRELVDGIDPDRRCSRVLLAGGASAEPALAGALATLIERQVARVDEPEAVLLGAARLAAGIDPFVGAPARPVAPDPDVPWLPAKYRRWREWLSSRLAEA